MMTPMPRRDAIRRSSKLDPLPTPSRSDPLTASELWLLAFAGGNLILTPWMLGGMVVWSQFVSLALSIGAIVCALNPGKPDSSSSRRKRLLRFPIFWVGLAYFAFIGLQMMNPAWEYRVVGQGWHLVRIPHAKWLPHGIKATPYSAMNAWRILVIHGAVWLMVCALWVGVTRRKIARTVLTLVAVNGALVAAVFVLQRLTTPDRILWLWHAPADYFVAGFVYKNHGGAFFNLVLAACLSIAAWHAIHAERQMKKSHPGLLFVFLGLLILVAQSLTYARAATLSSLVIIFGIGVAIGIRLLFRSVNGMPGSIVAVLALLAIGFVGVCAVSLKPERIWDRFGRLLKEDEASSITARQIATRATLTMAKESIVVGHGAGGFRFLFPLYQQHYPDIYGDPGSRMFWEHAHDDYAEGLAEYGLTGVALASAALACLVLSLWRSRILRHAPLLAALSGPAAVFANGAVDFPFQNPAVLLTTLACLTLVARWAQLEPKIRMMPAPLRD